MDTDRLAAIAAAFGYAFLETLETLDMDASDSIGVYGEAKAEYTRQLCIFLVPALEGYFLDLLTETKEKEKDPRRILWIFQDALRQFPDWNMDKVQRETEKILTATKCDYLEEILTAVFIAHTKVLSAIRLTSKQKKLQITIPKLEHFLHRTMSECARQLWSNAYLLSEQGSAMERQKNLRQVEQLLHEGVLQSIRSMLPVKSILKEYLNDDGEGEETAATAEEVTSAAATTAAAAAQEEATTVPDKEEAAAATTAEPAVATAPVTEEPAIPAATETAIPESVPLQDTTESIRLLPPPPPPIVDLSGSVIPSPHAEMEAAVDSIAAATAAAPAPAPATTIVVDTEPPVVSFSQHKTVFDSQNLHKNNIEAMDQEQDDEEEGNYTVRIREDLPPEEVDDFEDLDAAPEDEDAHSLAADEFETL